MFMKSLHTKIVAYFKKENQLKYEVSLRKQLIIYFNSKMSIKEIELFLDIRLKDFNESYFKTYYPKYLKAFDEMNAINLLKYIDQVEGLKKELMQKVSKKLAYPLILIAFSLLVLIFFNNSVVPLLSDYINVSLHLIIKFTYYISLLLLLGIILLVICLIYISRNKYIQLQLYNRFSNYQFMKIVQIYYEMNFVYLLLTYYDLAYSTKQIFSSIRKYKDNPIAANLAYYAENDLIDGEGLLSTINKMNISTIFKQVLNISINSNTFSQTLHSYNNNLNYQLDYQINKIGKIMYVFAYIYLMVLLIVFYSILSLPLQMINII